MFLRFEAAGLHVFYIAHWAIPWLILALGMYTIIKFVRGYIDRQPFTQAERKLFVIFRNLMKIQGVTGLVYVVWSGLITHSLPMYRVTHGVTMFVAAIILPLSSRWRDEDDATRYLNHFYLLLASFLIMLVGLALVPSVTGR
jgi:hypothetical protein